MSSPPPSAPSSPAAPPAGAKSAGLLDLTVNTLAGKPQPLAEYRGKVLLIVNTASECGYTPQYDGLERLHQRYRERGLVVLGFPSNDFGAQEPGSAQQIAKFCKARFGVTFPLFEKSHARGAEASPLFRILAARHGEPKWNFYKYLVGKDGQVRRAFSSDVEPEGAELQAAIESALAE